MGNRAMFRVGAVVALFSVFSRCDSGLLDKMATESIPSLVCIGAGLALMLGSIACDAVDYCKSFFGGSDGR